MSPLPLATLHARRIHRIVRVDFSEGMVACTCEATVTVPASPHFDRDEALSGAWAEHRKANGVASSKWASISSEHDGVRRQP